MNRSGGRLLVVDDGLLNRMMLTQALEQQGHQCATAVDGSQALELLRAEPFDLVLLDVVMPELNGYEVLAALHEDPTLRHLPVIMISAVDEMDSVIRCIQMGAEDYLTKPFDPVLLQARVDACLEKKRLRDREQSLYAQLQEHYRQLQELEQLRDSLTQMIVHDLRTPLTSILLGLQTVRDRELGTPADREEALAVAIRGAETLLGMINDLLDISKLESGTPVLEIQDSSVPVIVDQAWRQVANLAHRHGLALTRTLADDLPPLAADAEKLTRVLVNLLGNAIKFTPAPGMVALTVTCDAQAVHFAVRDSGYGIPAEAFERIFEKFGQVATRQRGAKHSTGLGLTFCKMVVEAHGGRIWVASELERGSTFTFTLPLVAASAVAQGR